MRSFWIILGVLICLPKVVLATGMPDCEFGLRGGVSSNRIDRVHKDYTVGGLYFLKNLSWRYSFSDVAVIRSRFDAGALALYADSDTGALISAGADVVFSLQGHFEFEVGFRPTWMTDHRYGGDDFGGPIQFSSHAGIAVVWRNLTLGYRIQHTSNAGIYSPNPGLNLHLINVGYRF